MVSRKLYVVPESSSHISYQLSLHRRSKGLPLSTECLVWYSLVSWFRSRLSLGWFTRLYYQMDSVSTLLKGLTRVIRHEWYLCLFDGFLVVESYRMFG